MQEQWFDILYPHVALQMLLNSKLPKKLSLLGRVLLNVRGHTYVQVCTCALVCVVVASLVAYVFQLHTQKLLCV